MQLDKSNSDWVVYLFVFDFEWFECTDDHSIARSIPDFYSNLCACGVCAFQT